MSTVIPAQLQHDRVRTLAIQLLADVRAGSEPAERARCLVSERRGFLPLGTTPADLVEVAVNLAKRPRTH